MISLADDPTGGSIQGTLEESAVGGVAVFPALSLDISDEGYPNGYALLASAADGGLTPGKSDIFHVTPLTATHLAVVTEPPSTQTAGALFSTAIAGVDPYGNVDPTFNGSVGITFAPGGDPSNTTLGGTLTQTASNGVATFANLSLTAAQTGYELQGLGLVQGFFSTATTVPLNITAGSTTQFQITSQPSNVTVNSPIAFTVSAEDNYGNVDTTFQGSVNAALAANPTGASLGGTITENATNGQATFSNLTVNQPGVGYTLKATSGALIATTGSFTVTAGKATQLAVTQTPSAGITAGNLFTVTVSAEDKYGFVDQTFNGPITIALANNPTNTSLGGTLTVTAVNGVAAFSNLQLTVAANGYTLQATGPGLTATTSDAVNVSPGKATQLVVTTQPGGVIAGQNFGLVVSAEDSYFNVDPTFTGSIALALGTNPGNTSLLGNLTANAVKGVATFSGLRMNVADPGYTIQASANGVSTGATNPFTVTANKASKLAVTMQPTGVVAGSGFSFAVSAEDSLGNIDQSFNGTVSVSLFTNPGNSSLGGNLYAQAVNGTATFTNLTLNVADPGYILQAIYSGLSATTTAAFTVSPGQASKLVMVSQPPTSVTAGAGFGFVVEALDSSGNLATGFGGTVTAVIGSNPGGSTLGGSVTATASNGVATLSGLFLNFADPGYTIQATSTGITAATTNSITVTAGKATQLVATTEPAGSVNAGSSITFVVAAEDHYGNIDTTFSNLVSVSLTSNPGNGTLGGTTTVGPVNGVATFNTLSLTAAGAGYVVQASSSGVTAGTSTAFTVKADKATQLVLTTEPTSSVTAGAGFGFVLNAEDQYGNVDPTFAGPVLASLVNNPGGSTLGGNLQATITNGVVTFSGLTLNKADPGYTLVANSLTLSSQATSAITVNAGKATQLVVTTQPSGVIAGQSFGFSVSAEDNFGNVDPTFNGTVTVALANNPGSTTLGGTLTASASQGVATFSGLKLSVADTGYTLQATSIGLNAGATNPFTVTAGKATQLVVLMANEPPTSVTAGVGFGFVVYAEDALGNIDLSFDGPVTAALASNSAGSTLGGSPSAFVSAGVAIFSGLTLNLVGTGYSLQASSPGLGSITTTAINVTPGTATQLVISSEPPASVLVDGPFGLVVKAEDSEGNVDPTYGGSITLSLLNNPGGASLGGNVSVNANAGVASFSGLTVNQAGAPDTIEATATGLVAATSTPFVAAFSVPTTTATLSGTVGTNGWYRSAVTVSLSASDPVFSVTSTFVAIDSGSFAAYTGPVRVSGDGLHTVSYYSVNSAGKQEAVETTNIQIDTVAPSTSESTTGITGKAGYSTALTLTLTATDATSGVLAARTTRSTAASRFTRTTGPASLPDGNLVVTYYSVDVAGNQGTAKSFSAKVDSTPPVTTATITGTAGLNGYYRSSVSVKLKATDNVSGVAATYYRIGTTGAFTAYHGTVFSFTAQGSHTITYYSVDFAGNKEPVETTTIVIDTVAPPVSITTLTPATVVSNIVTVAGTSQTNTTISVVLSDIKGHTVTGITTTDSTGHWTLNLDASTLSDGVLTATVTAIDLAGNTRVVRKATTKSSQVVMVVTTQPVTVRQGVTMPSVVVQLEDGFGHLLNLFGDDVTVAVANGTVNGTLTETTNLQGQAIFYDLSFSPPGTYSLQFTAAGIQTIESRSFTVTA